MKQISLTMTGYFDKGKKTKREQFLAEMDQVVPWARLCALIEPHYPKASPTGGRPPLPLERMLRIYCLQQWYNLSDPGAEEALYDSITMRQFAGVSTDADIIPDETSILNFRRLLESHQLTERLLAEINAHLCERGLLVGKGTIVDATIIDAPSSTKNAKKKRDPQMHQTRKGKQWYFGMKVHTGVDAGHTIIRRVHVTDASITDTEPADRLFCGDEQAVYGDQAYYTHARHARLTEAGIKDRLMHRPNKHHKLRPRQKQRNKLIAKVRAAVERPYAVFKEHYGLRRLRFFNFERNHMLVVLACCAYNLRRAAGALAALRRESACA